MNISVAICTLNGASRLPATLEALRGQKDIEGIEWELLLIDNNSTDDTWALFKKFQTANPQIHCRIIHEAVPGNGAAYRRAYREASAPWICMVDDDNLLASDYLKKGIHFAFRAASHIGAFGGRSVGKIEGSTPFYFKSFPSSLAIWDGGDVERQLIFERPFTAGLFLRVEAIRSVLLETWLTTGRSPCCPFGGEDTEMYLKLTRRGWQYWYVPALSFLHVMPRRRLELTSLLRLRVLQGGESQFLALGYSNPKKPLLAIALWQYFVEGWAKFLVRCLLFCTTPGQRRWYQLSELSLRWGYIRYFYLGLIKFGLRRNEVALAHSESGLLAETK